MKEEQGVPEGQVDEIVIRPDYAYKDIAEYEEIIGAKVNEGFRIGWDMARVTNSQLKNSVMTELRIRGS